ncbi:MAG TPA: ORF6N domain-containing protein [Verrucomicrobiae bacterium]|nr:ORF6N domain-containing protein [Verrucomicrobiae bacterium]
MPQDIDSLIIEVRGQKVILDADLARIYEVPTKALNQAVKRNADKFPPDFLFRLTEKEAAVLRSQIVTSSFRHGGPRYRPHAFTEHGALMAATVLNSPRAVKMSLFIIRAFVKIREGLAANAAILKRLAEIDRTLLVHDVTLREILEKLRPLLAPTPKPPTPEIGFHVKEDSVPYRIKRRTARP